MKNILIVEDEPKILELLEAFLSKEGYIVFKAEDGREALDIFNKEDIHLLILDLMIPKISGEEVCKKVRSKSDIPIIMLTAKAEEEDKLEGLEIGADDYITKPFSIKELASRINVIMRRCYSDSPTADKFVFNDGDLEINMKTFEVLKNGVDMKFTPNEFKILKLLISNRGMALERDLILEKVIGIDFEGIDRTIDVHIKNIRQKIEDNPRKPKYIKTVYAVGYKFND